MTKELFVSTTPHETKVGLVEDDLLAEIYLERENEYTLAGSIYKGRVTRVLPGMQSAFVDIGLERDAFLYVSDFMELQDEDEVEEIPTNLVPSQPYQSPARTEAQPSVGLASVDESNSRGRAYRVKRSACRESRTAEPGRKSRRTRRLAQPSPPWTPRRAHAGIQVCSAGFGRAPRRSSRTR